MKILFIIDILTIAGEAELNIITTANLLADTYNVGIYTNQITEKMKQHLKGIKLYEKFSDRNDKKIIKEGYDIINASPFYSLNKAVNLVKESEAKLFINLHKVHNNFLTKEIADMAEKVIYFNETARDNCKDLVSEDKGILILSPVDSSIYRKKTIKNKKLLNTINLKYKTIVISANPDDGKENQIIQFIKIIPELLKTAEGLNIIILGHGSKLHLIVEIQKSIESEKIKFITGDYFKQLEYLNIADLVLAGDRRAVEAIFCSKPVFYFDETNWKKMVSDEAYYDTLFTNKGYIDYTNDELFEAIRKGLDIKTTTTNYQQMRLELMKLCSISKVRELFIKTFKEQQ